MEVTPQALSGAASKLVLAQKGYYAQMSYNNGEEKLEFPIVPSNVEVSEAGQGKTYNVPGIGEINVIGSKSLSEISFSGLFPAQYYPFVSVSSRNMLQPVQYIKLINKWMRIKHPIRFIFCSDTYDINTAATIESFTWNEAVGTKGDVEYSIKLKQYIFYRARKLKSEGALPTASTGGTTRASDKQPSKTYKVVAGDSLWDIARKQLGDSGRHKEIQKLNGISDADVYRLQIGRVLKLP